MSRTIPVVLAFAIVPASGKPELFIDPAKVGPEAKAHLAPLAKLRPLPDIDKPKRWRRACARSRRPARPCA